MEVPGETDLVKMLDELSVVRRDGVFTFVEVRSPDRELLGEAQATVIEGDRTTLVMLVESAERVGLPVLVELAWLTLTVESSLEAVGLTAFVSARLADAGIACNVLAGFRHDHLLVPLARADDAVGAIRERR